MLASVTSDSNVGVPSQQVTVGVRPEHFSVTGTGLPFKVESAEALGADSLIHGFIARHGQVLRVDGHARHQNGEVLHVTPHADKLYFFDTASGKRI